MNGLVGGTARSRLGASLFVPSIVHPSQDSTLLLKNADLNDVVVVIVVMVVVIVVMVVVVMVVMMVVVVMVLMIVFVVVVVVIVVMVVMVVVVVCAYTKMQPCVSHASTDNPKKSGHQ